MTQGSGLDMNEILKAAQLMQERMQKAQDELDRLHVEGSAGGGMVSAVVNGRQELLSVKIEAEVVDPAEIPMLQDLVVAAVNQALRRSQDLAKDHLSKVTGQMGFKMPDLF